MITLLNKTQRAGGASMTPRSARRLFGDDTRKARNLYRVCANPTLIQAVRTGVLANSRTVEPLLKFDDGAARIIVRLEAKLGRTLSYDRAQALQKAYRMIRVHRLAAESVKRMIASFAVSPREAPQLIEA